MRVGIITFHDVPNYGAVLQTYALQRVIRMLGHDCEVIDYKNQYFEEIYKPILWKDLKYKKYFLKKLVSIPKTLSRKKKIQDFVGKRIVLSETRFTQNTLRESNAVYDCFITGSDQVWNPAINGNDASYFLDFVDDDQKKHSYAASYAIKKLTEKEEEYFLRYLQSFKSISVRECEGVKALEDILKRKVYDVVDPTLLIKANEWEHLVVSHDNDPYILVYLMSPDDRIIEYAKLFAKEKRIKVKYISLYSAIGLKGMEVISDPSVEEWLGLIANADYVLANSFHGIVFSIIFQKNFMYATISDAGRNTRITSMLNTFGIVNRELDLNNINNNFHIINYSDIQSNIINARERSLDYLNSFLNKCNDIKEIK